MIRHSFPKSCLICHSYCTKKEKGANSMRWLYKLVLSVLHNTTEGKNYICNFNIKATVCLKFHMWQVNYSGAHVLLYPRCLDYYKWNKTLNVIRKYSERRINCLKKISINLNDRFFFCKGSEFFFFVLQFKMTTNSVM